MADRVQLLETRLDELDALITKILSGMFDTKSTDDGLLHATQKQRINIAHELSQTKTNAHLRKLRDNIQLIITVNRALFNHDTSQSWNRDQRMALKSIYDKIRNGAVVSNAPPKIQEILTQDLEINLHRHDESSNYKKTRFEIVARLGELSDYFYRHNVATLEL